MREHTNNILKRFTNVPTACLFCAITLTAFTAPHLVHADYLKAIGYTALEKELGPSMPTGSDVIISQIEARSKGAYLPNDNYLEFSGKTLRNHTGTHAEISFHANDVGKLLYGNTLGVAPSVSLVDVYEAIDWYGRVLLRSDNGFIGEPLIEPNRIQNHSWIANRQAGTPTEIAIKIIRLFDYTITRDSIISVVSVHNDKNEQVPDLLSHNYNAITVGKSSGDHSAGTTIFDGIGRSKPDLVAPFESTSFSVPVISGTAALLLEHIDAHPKLAGGAKPEVMKAILMAGATKNEFDLWRQGNNMPLDPTYGAGELNIQNSYHILDAGEQNPSRHEEVPIAGWDLHTIDPGKTNTYFFSAPEDTVLIDFSAMLVWNRIITDTDPGPTFETDAFLPDHDLALHDSDNFLTNAERVASRTDNDNLEHLFVRRLPAGQFMLSVTSSTGGEYGLAWRASTVLLPRLSNLDLPPGDVDQIHDMTDGDSNPVMEHDPSTIRRTPHSNRHTNTRT